MKSDPEGFRSPESDRLTSKSKKSSASAALSDESLLDSFDPVIEGYSFQILDEGIDLTEFSNPAPNAASLEAPEVLESFDLSESLASVPNKIFFRIGEAADLLDVKPYVLRFWETEFPMVRPTKSRSGQRVYRKKDVEMLLLIKHLLYVERFSIEGARKRIRELKLKPTEVATTLVPTPEAAPAIASVPVDTARIRELLDSARTLASAELSKFFRF